MQPLHVLILAAGEGTRMRSRHAKLLHPCAGVPLVVHPVRAACALDPLSVHVVVGPEDDALRAALAGYEVRFAVQQTATGTADAVAAGMDALDADAGRLLVLNGDCPGVTTAALRALVDASSDTLAAVLAVAPADRRGYGRLVHNEREEFVAIVEEADMDARDDAGTYVNGGVYCFDLAAARTALEQVDSDNAQGERYLTRLFRLLADQGGAIKAVPYADAEELHGVNSRAELARAEALLRRRTAARLMDEGVTLRDPASTYVDIDVRVGADTVVHPGVTLEGDTVIGCGCEIRAHARISNSRLGDGVSVLDGSIVEESVVASRATLGPYARLRPGSDIGAAAKVGNFVETKATSLGAGSKASHLTYLGNARVGENVNIGAGTITCNYDGVEKHETIIEDGAFIGSNTALVAPVRIGKNAYVGAGSTITEDVPDAALGVARGRQVNKKGWADKKDSR